MPGREPGIVQIQTKTGGKRGKRCNRGRLKRRGRLVSRGALPILANFPRIQILGSCSFPSYLGWNLNCVHHASYMTHSQMLGKFEYTGGPIFKVVLEC